MDPGRRGLLSTNHVFGLVLLGLFISRRFGQLPLTSAAWTKPTRTITTTASSRPSWVTTTAVRRATTTTAVVTTTRIATLTPPPPIVHHPWHVLFMNHRGDHGEKNHYDKIKCSSYRRQPEHWWVHQPCFPRNHPPRPLRRSTLLLLELASSLSSSSSSLGSKTMDSIELSEDDEEEEEQVSMPLVAPSKKKKNKRKQSTQQEQASSSRLESSSSLQKNKKKKSNNSNKHNSSNIIIQTPEPQEPKQKQQRKPNQVPRRPLETRHAKFERMVQQLQEYRQVHGHTLVSNKPYDKELFVWAQSIRKNYQPPLQPQQEQLENNDKNNNNDTNNYNDNGKKKPVLSLDKQRQLEEAGFVWDVQAALWNRKYEQFQRFVQENGHAAVPWNHPDQLGIWIRNQRREYRKLQQGLNSTLLTTTTMTTRAMTAATTVAAQKEQIDRLTRLQALDFMASTKSRDASWHAQYQALKEFFQCHGHSNVPEEPSATPTIATNNEMDMDTFFLSSNFSSLGHWCMNQRTAYRRKLQGLPTALTKRKMDLLNKVNFTWNVQESKWQTRLNQLKIYYQEHGHVQIPPHDVQHRPLRLWLTFQRYYYNLRNKQLQRQEKQTPRMTQAKALDGRQRQQPNQSAATSWTNAAAPAAAGAADADTSVVPCPLTPERIQALEEAIPNFSWKLRGGNANNGPSLEDWKNLLRAVHDKGIRPGMRPKPKWLLQQHQQQQQQQQGAFRSNNNGAFKDVWTEQDLLELWNQESEEDDYKYALDHVGSKDHE